ncbi:helix-turn-helix transcriptional regulator [Photobacterium lipolyticum]|uniref:AraC family transcriptional regulator n=1 Tax=Photobacterium lipolyticum TaxID=266810 RepID=A0A2T3N2G4_9GAMM|nr:AraC family transcriptional regulator [Photobacterium lipolyticum]PSW06567.1 AraC family transcriptional regulator [Photobacterium lipolyticum]
MITKNHDLQLYKELTRFVHEPTQLNQVFFAGNQPEPPELAYQVNFPRLELVIEGVVPMEIGGEKGQSYTENLTLGQALFLPAFSWNKPDWQQPATILSLLFGKQTLGFSILHWDGENFQVLSKESVQRRGPRIGAFILRTLEELTWHPEDQCTARLIVSALLSHALDLIQHPPETLSRSQTLFEAIRGYIEKHYQEPLTRESVATQFYISANYLSQLFHREGKIRFNEYLNQTRLERAKYLLKQYDMKVKEVAHRCGFSDSNYFCRIFRQHTDRSPSEYRVQYRSQLTDFKDS